MADRPSLLRRFLGLAPAAESKAYPASGVTFTGPDTAQIVYLANRANTYQTEQLDRSMAFAVSAYCYTAMLWRASRMAAAPLMVVQEDEDGESWVPDHPLVPLLEQPRPDVAMGELLERTQMYRDGTGGALWVPTRDTVSRLAMLTPYSAYEFRSRAVAPLIYGAYEVLDPTGAWRPVPLEGLVHFRETNPASWRDPVSKVDAALLQLDLGHNVNRIVHAFLRKAMFPGGVISPDKEWSPSPEEWKDWKQQVELWYAGPANQGKPLAVLGGTTITQPGGLGMQDLLPEAILDRVEATVGSVFGTPPVVLGWLSGMKNSPWSQMAEARRQVYEDTIEPLWEDVSRRLSSAWLTPEERASGLLIRFDTSRIRALKGDMEQQARIVALTGDVLTVNERRILLEQEPLAPDDPRGEEIVGLRQPDLAASLGAGGAGDPNATDPNADPSQDPGADPQLGAGQKANADTKDLLWLLFDTESKDAESSWERVVYQHLIELQGRVVKAAQRTLVAEKARKATPESVRAYQLELTSILDQDRPRLQAKTYPLLVQTGGKAVRRLSARIGLSFSVLEPGLLKYASEESAFLARVMGKTTGEAVAASVQAGLDAGETIAGLVKRLQQLPEFDRPRAKMTARTETTRAWNGAQRRSMSEYQATTGKQATKSWLSARDSRVRDEHVALDDGSFIPIDAAFDNGLQEPGEPNCRCTLLYGFADSDTPLAGTAR